LDDVTFGVTLHVADCCSLPTRPAVRRSHVNRLHRQRDCKWIPRRRRRQIPSRDRWRHNSWVTSVAEWRPS